MKLEQSFEVAAPLERVWQALIDVEQVAPCLPGAAVTGRNEDGSYNGTFTVKIGPTTASYSGKLEMEEVDEAGHNATMNAQGTDKRGQGGATAKIVSRLEPVDDDHTRVSVDTDYRITGRLARFGRGGMIEDISERLLREFAGRLQASLERGGPPGGESASQVADPSPEPAAGDEPAPLAPDE
ncbi:MAG TPA: SRPBCC family protein, partial [Solirubrobacteraceae bacterium]|nr:SRPBCC family protein [Solirubrobacteraceae bacterium]